MNTEYQYDTLPLPAFRLNEKLSVVNCSDEARRLFGEISSFLEIVDEASANKAKKMLASGTVVEKFELNVIAQPSNLILADVFAKWDSQFSLSVILVPKDGKMERVIQQLGQLRSRLNETDYDLFLEKERTADLLQQVQELSAPCIQLDRDRLLIPLFGELSREKVEAVSSRLLENIYQVDAEMVILDFTAMTKITSQGLTSLESLLQTISVMGTESIICGVKPIHAKKLHHLQSLLSVKFISSLQEVIALRPETSKS